MNFILKFLLYIDFKKFVCCDFSCERYDIYFSLLCFDFYLLSVISGVDADFMDQLGLLIADVVISTSSSPNVLNFWLSSLIRSSGSVYADFMDRLGLRIADVVVLSSSSPNVLNFWLGSLMNSMRRVVVVFKFLDWLSLCIPVVILVYVSNFWLGSLIKGARQTEKNSMLRPDIMFLSFLRIVR